jgi:hypothetical protein
MLRNNCPLGWEPSVTTVAGLWPFISISAQRLAKRDSGEKKQFLFLPRDMQRGTWERRNKVFIIALA